MSKDVYLHMVAKTAKKRVLIGLSGGVDSAVSAWKLIQKGYHVEAAFMKNWSSTKGLKFDQCPWLQDRQDALRVAAFLGIPMHTIDFEKQYEENVLNYFFEEYRAGRTPNPDVMCNKEIKFKLLYNWAIKDHGFDFIATGHYAQVKKTKNHYTLARSKDDFKDQTYFIYNILRAQLEHVLFPIGDMKKPAVKKLAEKIGLPNAKRKESMGLCFVGKIRLKEFLDQKLQPQKGTIADTEGKILGEHDGLAYYTLGQRQGIKIGENGPWYVAQKDIATNTLIVTNDPKDPLLECKELDLHSVNWITDPKSFPATLQARYRHQGNLEDIMVTKSSQDLAMIHIQFKKPQLAVSSGQSIVMYDGKTCVGGGVIV